MRSGEGPGYSASFPHLWTGTHQIPFWEAVRPSVNQLHSNPQPSDHCVAASVNCRAWQKRRLPWGRFLDLPRAGETQAFAPSPGVPSFRKCILHSSRTSPAPAPGPSLLWKPEGECYSVAAGSMWNSSSTPGRGGCHRAAEPTGVVLQQNRGLTAAALLVSLPPTILPQLL